MLMVVVIIMIVIMMMTRWPVGWPAACTVGAGAPVD
jgi:hypothetical protein